MVAAPDAPWSGVMSPALDKLKPEAARALLELKFTKAQLARMHELSGLSKQGRLTEEQSAELEKYLQLGHMLTLLHSKARMALKKGTPRGRRKSA
jgi:hypothetical protein